MNAKKGNVKKKSPPPVPGTRTEHKFEIDVKNFFSDIITHETAFAVEERCAKFQLQVLKMIGAPRSEQNFVANRKPREFNYAHDGNFTITP